jgi:hypothetical protein
MTGWKKKIENEARDSVPVAHSSLTAVPASMEPEEGSGHRDLIKEEEKMQTETKKKKQHTPALLRMEPPIGQ